ncbi:uncharacterized protein LOC106660137 [Trichogramma pretiosum]|uniref:uncharacterized protein LOC106660137 n=1 Tax=Trichogramma pretiosum TaxID=7493 RepID=UPI0006C95FF3|nr:uncharacterized protein LOC106660137 [Trichogramma pretiosum]
MASISNTTICPKKSIENGVRGLKLAMLGDYEDAINAFVDALYYDCDIRHYLNLCNCFIRQKEFKLAKDYAKEALSILKQSNSPMTSKYKFLTQFIMGQAHYGLKNYKEAEVEFSKAFALFPTSRQVANYLRCVKIQQILDFGFSYKDAVKALKNYPNTEEAIKFLYKSNPNSKTKELEEEFSHSDCDDWVFDSDEDENLLDF